MARSLQYNNASFHETALARTLQGQRGLVVECIPDRMCRDDFWLQR